VRFKFKYSSVKLAVTAKASTGCRQRAGDLSKATKATWGPAAVLALDPLKQRQQLATLASLVESAVSRRSPFCHSKLACPKPPKMPRLLSPEYPVAKSQHPQAPVRDADLPCLPYPACPPQDRLERAASSASHLLSLNSLFPLPPARHSSCPIPSSCCRAFSSLSLLHPQAAYRFIVTRSVSSAHPPAPARTREIRPAITKDSRLTTTNPPAIVQTTPSACIGMTSRR
jgi:hypothetical protein